MNSIEYLSPGERVRTLDIIMEVLGVDKAEARLAFYRYREKYQNGPGELHIPINKNMDIFIRGMRVVIDPDVENMVAMRPPEKEPQ